MNRKQKIIISVTGIFIVMLILVGLTYAYFLTQITGNTKDKSISVTTADLRVVYGDGTKELLTSSTKLVPSSNAINTKDFTVTNTGDATEYAVIIENVRVKVAGTENLTTFESNDFKYTLTCTKSDGTSCNGVSTQTTLPMSDSILVTNEIDSDDTHTYVITLWYLDNGKDQSSDMNKTLSARLNIEDPNRINPYSNNTNLLSYKIINSALNVTEEQRKLGYAQYRSVPITDMSIGTSSKVIGHDPSSYSSLSMTNNQNNYYVYSDTYSLTNNGRGYILDNPKVIQYSSGFNSLKGKYITNLSGYSTESAANTYAEEGKVLYDLYKVSNSISLSYISYGRVPSSTTTESLESTLSTAKDDYGTSFYYRGGVKNNYVSFAGFDWRIVRINGDGSVRLILDGTLDKVKKEGVSVYTNAKLSALDSDGKVPFNTKNDDNAYVGYMYGNFTGSSTSYEAAHKNEVNSTLKTYIDTFYEEYLNDYSGHIADSLFCGDKTLKSSLSTTTNGFGKVYTEYAVYERLDDIGNATPTLECAKDANNTYSRYTANATETTKGVTVNNDLKYPIGLLSADEIVHAGGDHDSPNDSYYLSDSVGYQTPTSYYDWWTMSPKYGGSWANGFVSNPTSGSLNYYDTAVDESHGVRPVINLKASSLISGGNGTQGSPYTIQ